MEPSLLSNGLNGTGIPNGFVRPFGGDASYFFGGRLMRLISALVTFSFGLVDGRRTLLEFYIQISKFPVEIVSLFCFQILLLTQKDSQEVRLDIYSISL